MSPIPKFRTLLNKHHEQEFNGGVSCRRAVGKTAHLNKGMVLEQVGLEADIRKGPIRHVGRGGWCSGVWSHGQPRRRLEAEAKNKRVLWGFWVGAQDEAAVPKEGLIVEAHGAAKIRAQGVNEEGYGKSFGLEALNWPLIKLPWTVTVRQVNRRGNKQGVMHDDKVRRFKCTRACMVHRCILRCGG